jgi:hypothetical protein
MPSFECWIKESIESNADNKTCQFGLSETFRRQKCALESRGPTCGKP